MEAGWDLDHLIGYLRTWSAVQRFKEKHGTDPIEDLAEDLKREWSPAREKKLIHWPINMRAGKIH